MTAGFRFALWILAAACPVAAQNPPAPASSNPSDTELREIVKKSVEEDNLNFEPSRNYVYLEDTETRLVDAKGKVT
jgi:hypothetical protein